jgi:hypothetical protein
MFDGSVAMRPLENSDSDEVRLEFIGIPPSTANVPQRDGSVTGVVDLTLLITVAESLT